MVLPKNLFHVMNMKKKQYDLAKQCDFENNNRCIVRRIKVRKKSIASLDEYTSVRNRRHFNINLHLSTKFWNLRMIPITRSLPA